MHSWARPLSTLLLTVVAGLVAWPLLGREGALLLVCLLMVALLLHHLRSIAALFHWLHDPRRETVPNGFGVWDDIFYYVSRMLRRQRQSEDRLNVALTRFQLAGAALPDAVVLLDAGYRIDWCNPMAERFLGLQLERDRGKQVTYIVRQPQFAEYLAAGQVNDPLVIRSMTGHGELVLSIQIVPYGNSQKLLLGRDITRWERLETTRRDFIANVSHELRTPLTVVHGFLETISDSPTVDPALLAQSIPLMSQQTARMTRLVEDLLTLSRLESAHTALREDNVDVPELARTLAREAEALSGGKHRIALKIESDDWLKGNGDELRSAFGNLVSNAVRYTPAGGTIELCWSRPDDHSMFSVRDTGIGIEPHHIDRLTERFYRVDKSRSRETGGTGLGLAIVKHVANRHQARLEIDSEPGKGSVFRMRFPETRRLGPRTPDRSAPAAAQS
jgi:two-component system, OmpR family, phosphate regulon sensor histidine kinase PhoR